MLEEAAGMEDLAILRERCDVPTAMRAQPMPQLVSGLTGAAPITGKIGSAALGHLQERSAWQNFVKGAQQRSRYASRRHACRCSWQRGGAARWSRHAGGLE